MYYEATFIARQDLSVAQVESLTKVYTDLVKTGGGEVREHEYWGLRPLAYPIRKNSKGHYVFFRIEAPSSALEEVKRHMKLNEDVIRNLFVKVNKLEEGPSAMMRPPKERYGRERDGSEGDREEGHRRPRYGSETDRPSPTPSPDSQHGEAQ